MFAWLAYYDTSTISTVTSASSNLTALHALLGVSLSRRTAYTVASALCISIAPFTQLVMLPAANQRLREMGALEAEGRGDEVDREELRVMCERFGALNYARGFILGVGGVVGLVGVLG